jgi:hypothetical protein
MWASLLLQSCWRCDPCCPLHVSVHHPMPAAHLLTQELHAHFLLSRRPVTLSWMARRWRLWVRHALWYKAANSWVKPRHA